MKSAALYARFSPRPNAEESESIATQTAAMEAYCNLMKLSPAFRFEDPEVSAGDPFEKRPGGEQLAALLAAGEVKDVVTNRLDRAFRSVTDAILTVERWDKIGVTLHIVNMGGMPVNTTSATGRLILTMLSGITEWERRTIGERTSAGMRFRQANGQRMSRHLPYGFKEDPKSPKNAKGMRLRMLPCEQEQAVIARIVELHRNGASKYRIAKELNCLGMPNRGRKWRPTLISRIIERVETTR